MSLGGYLEEEGYTNRVEGIYEPPFAWQYSREKQKEAILLLAENELLADRDLFIRVFGKGIAERIEKSWE